MYNYFIKLAAMSLCLSAIFSPVFAGDIAFGTIKGIKVYDFPNSKVTKIFFNADASHQTESNCAGIAHISEGAHSALAAQNMLSIALSAFMSGKKVRAYSAVTGSCEVGLISIQDSYY
jgi:hypothetical protein